MLCELKLFERPTHRLPQRLLFSNIGQTSRNAKTSVRRVCEVTVSSSSTSVFIPRIDSVIPSEANRPRSGRCGVEGPAVCRTNGKQVPPRARRFAKRIIPARLSLSLLSTLSSRAKQIVRVADDAKSRDLLFAAVTESGSLHAPDDSQGESSGLVGMTEL